VELKRDNKKLQVKQKLKKNQKKLLEIKEMVEKLS